MRVKRLLGTVFVTPVLVNGLHYLTLPDPQVRCETRAKGLVFRVVNSGFGALQVERVHFKCGKEPDIDRLDEAFGDLTHSCIMSSTVLKSMEPKHFTDCGRTFNTGIELGAIFPSDKDWADEMETRLRFHRVHVIVDFRYCWIPRTGYLLRGTSIREIKWPLIRSAGEDMSF